MDYRITDALSRRAGYIGKTISPLFIGLDEMSVYVAGGSLNGKINDIDLFPARPHHLHQIVRENRIISKTPNATTIQAEPWPVQLCNYEHNTLQALVDSFDYAHIQAGAKLTWENERMRVVDVYCTDGFVAANAINSTWFCGSAYPLSSLMRAGKYYKRGAMLRGAYIRCVIDSLVAVIQRGFKSHEDFKDQLDAVDLGILPEDLAETGASRFKDLFDLLDRPQL